MRSLMVTQERFPIAGSFRIARGARTEAAVVSVAVSDGTAIGRGEAVPYARYGESVEGVSAAIEAMAARVADGIDADTLRAEMAAGSARNALDCALLDYEAKASGTPVAERLGLTLSPVTTAFTLSIDTPEAMGEAASAAAARPLLKVKLGAGAEDAARIAAVRAGAPDATLIVDANEGWNETTLLRNMSACADAGVKLVEQPLPASRDGALATISHPVAVCADESCHTAKDLESLRTRYDAVNIKLDKAGGLTEALTMVAEAKRLEFAVMIGCMVGTSLGMAPGVFAAQDADYVDLDGPLLLAADRTPGLTYDGSTIHPPPPELWG